MRGFDSCYPCIFKLKKKNFLFSKLARIEKNRKLITKFHKNNKLFFNYNINFLNFNNSNYKMTKNKSKFFFEKNLFFRTKNENSSLFTFYKNNKISNFKKFKILPFFLFLKFFFLYKFNFKNNILNIKFIKNKKNLNFFYFTKFYLFSIEIINNFSNFIFLKNNFNNFFILYFFYLNSFSNIFFNSFLSFNFFRFSGSKNFKKFFFFEKNKKNLYFSNFFFKKKKKKIFSLKKRELSFYFKLYPLIFTVIKYFYHKNNIFFYQMSLANYYYDNFFKITNDTYFYNKFTLMCFPHNILTVKQQFNNSFSFTNFLTSNFFEKAPEAYKNNFFRQNNNFFKKKNIWKKPKKSARFFFFYKKIVKKLINKISILVKKKKIKNKLFFTNDVPKVNFFLDNTNIIFKKKNMKINFFLKNNLFFKKKEPSFNEFNFLFFKNKQPENYLSLFFNPLYFKNFFYLKDFFYNFSSFFHNFQNNLIFSLEKSYFYSKPNSSFFFNNIFPLANSFNFTFKKYLLRTLVAKNYSILSMPYHYWSIIKFIEFCSGRKVYIRLNSFLYNILDEDEKFRCLIWSTKLRNFRKILGPKLFIRESLEILYTCFKMKDPYILSNWILGMLNKVSFWKYKLFFRYIQYILRYFFWTVFKDLKMKGLKFQLKGKISVAGNARTRTVRQKIGFTSHATFNNKILYNLNLIKTFTGVIGFKTWLVF